MGYFKVRYDSRVVNYDRRGFVRLATGLVVIGGDSCSKGCGFSNSNTIYWMDIFTFISCKNCNV